MPQFFRQFVAPLVLAMADMVRHWFAIYPIRWLSPKVSTFTGLSCHQKGYGLGKTVVTWYATGIPPTTPK